LRDEALHPIVVDWENVYADGSENSTYRSGRSSRLVLHNLARGPVDVDFDAVLYSADGALASLTAIYASRSETLLISGKGTPLAFRFTVKSGASAIQFETDARSVAGPGEPRTFVFKLVNPRVSRVERAADARPP